jgi:hypothetical protein
VGQAVGARSARPAPVGRVGTAPEMGPEMTLARSLRSPLLAFCCVAGCGRRQLRPRGFRRVRRATYAKKYDGWRRSFVSALRDKFEYPADHVIALAEKEEPGVALATRAKCSGPCWICGRVSRKTISRRPAHRTRHADGRRRRQVQPGRP